LFSARDVTVTVRESFHFNYLDAVIELLFLVKCRPAFQMWSKYMPREQDLISHVILSTSSCQGDKWCRQMMENNFAKRLFDLSCLFVCLSVHPHGTKYLPPDGFSWNIDAICNKFEIRYIPIWVKGGQK
jgi:hypothetical protein